MAGAGEDLWRSLDLAGMLAGEKLFDGSAAVGGFEVALGRDRAVLPDRQDVVLVVEMGAQRSQPFVPLQHQEMGFWHPFGLGGIEAARAIFDGVAAIGEQRLARFQRGTRELLRAEAFDGIPIDTGDLCRWGGGHGIPYEIPERGATFPKS